MKKIDLNRPSLGCWLQIPSTYTAELVAKAGFDWLAIDMEHGLAGIESVYKMIQVIELCDIAALVRVNENDPNLIRRVMDAGASGVIVPMVNTARDAIKAVEAVKYPPQGKRSFGLGRAHDFGKGFEKYIRSSNNDSTLVVQIETIEAVKNLDSILEVKGIDAIVIGPYDLSGSMGTPGDFESPKFKEAISTIIEKVKKTKTILGIHIVHPSKKELEQKINEGFRFIGYGMDTIFLAAGAGDALSHFKEVR